MASGDRLAERRTGVEALMPQIAPKPVKNPLRRLRIRAEDGTHRDAIMSYPMVSCVQDVASKVRHLQAAGKKVVFTNGCFDILHSGHIDLLSRARALGDILVVA